MSPRVAGDPPARGFHGELLASLVEAEVPFLVGGSVALTRYAGVKRDLTDFNLFMRVDDWPRATVVLNAAGIDTEVVVSHWLARAFKGDQTAGIIYNGENGLTRVDTRWFERAACEEMFGVTVRLCPPEELIWSKAFMMARESFHGADVLHLIRARHDLLDWDRLLELFELYPRVLLAHLVLFGFVYPDESDHVPPWLLAHLWSQIAGERREPAGAHLCRGPVLSRADYLVDIARWGYTDARMIPFGVMTPQEVEHDAPSTARNLSALRPHRH